MVRKQPRSQRRGGRLRPADVMLLQRNGELASRRRFRNSAAAACSWKDRPAGGGYPGRPGDQLDRADHHPAVGDILVVSATEPGWNPVFHVVSGLVVEAGGSLSHASCLSRELGLPTPNGNHRRPEASHLSVEGGNRRTSRVISYAAIRCDAARNARLARSRRDGGRSRTTADRRTMTEVDTMSQIRSHYRRIAHQGLASGQPA